MRLEEDDVVGVEQRGWWCEERVMVGRVAEVDVREEVVNVDAVCETVCLG
jgi:hypothetical protein